MTDKMQDVSNHFGTEFKSGSDLISRLLSPGHLNKFFVKQDKLEIASLKNERCLTFRIHWMTLSRHVICMHEVIFYKKKMFRVQVSRRHSSPKPSQSQAVIFINLMLQFVKLMEHREAYFPRIKPTPRHEV